MTVDRNMAVAVKIVEQHEFVSQLVVVGRYLGTEHYELGVAVSTPHIAEDLIERAIFFDDVQDIFNWRRIANFGGNCRLLTMRHAGEQLIGLGAVAVHSFGVGREFGRGWHRHDRERT